MNRTDRNALVVENLPLVGYLVSDLVARATHLSRDDLASAGSLALVTAADAYDASTGVPFGAYARTRILGALADELRASDWATRSARKRIKETLAVRESLTAGLGRTPTVDEIADALGVDRQTAAAGLADAARTVTALDETIEPLLVSDTTGPEESALVNERTAYVRAAVAALPDRMRSIVEAIYFDDRTVTEIAEELGITHSAVSQQRSEAIRLMREGMATHYADEGDPEIIEAKTSQARRSAYLARLAQHAVAHLPRPRLLTPTRRGRGFSACSTALGPFFACSGPNGMGGPVDRGVCGPRMDREQPAQIMEETSWVCRSTPTSRPTTPTAT